MNVTDAVSSRGSIRAFVDALVPDDLSAELVTKAARVPSGGNLQSWCVEENDGDRMPR